MLITERLIPNTHNATQASPAQQPNSTTAPQPTLEIKAIAANAAKLISKAGDRQSWLLLALILIPVFGMISNFMTYGLER